jgi:quercetin dioxygenase-like cupin family protein
MQFLESHSSLRGFVAAGKKYAKKRMEYLGGVRRAIQYAAGLALATSIVGYVRADDAAVRIIGPGSVTLRQQQAGPSSAYVVGGAQKTDLYVITAQYPAGLKSRPHTHPDQRIMTVISGTFYAGTGEEFEENNVRALKPGSILIIPPNTLHWGWAKDGDVVVQEVGVGPTGTQFPASATRQ